MAKPLVRHNAAGHEDIAPRLEDVSDESFAIAS